MSSLTFNEYKLNPINQDNQIWLTSAELANALGYARSDYVTAIYNRKKDEFTKSMTQVIEITENDKLTVSEKGGNLVKKIRIFSLRGCHLVAMFARTKIAKDFRKWVLNILDKEVGEPVQVPSHLTPTQTLPLRNAVNMATSILKLDYSTIYSMIHQRFNVEEIKELSLEQIPQAVEYVHLLMCHDHKQLFEVLSKNAMYLHEYMMLLKQLKQLSFIDERLTKNTFNFVRDSFYDIVQLAHDMNLRTPSGKPMFMQNGINFYSGNSLTWG